MATQNEVKKDVKYLNKEFGAFRNDLIEFARIYYPNSYTDFNEASPGMMFIEMASYVGDVLSYYIDSQFQESLMAFAEEKETIYQMAQGFGYKPKLATPANTKISIFQTVPAVGDAENNIPDLSYALEIPAGMEVISDNGIVFRTLESTNFKYSSSFDPMEISIFETDASTNLPLTYLLKKWTDIKSGTVITTTTTFGTAEKYPRIVLPNVDISEIINVTDSDGNKWYEVPFLAQDTTFDEIENSAAADPTLSQYSTDTPYLLKLVKTPRRFTRFIRSDGKTELRFGAGTSDSPDEELVPNPNNVGSSLPGSPSYLDTSFDPSNFLATRTYGLAPSNTTLTIKFAHGGGVDHNTISNTITNISNITYNIDTIGLSAALVQSSKDSVAVTNSEPAVGGRAEEPILEVRQNALAHFQSQNRAVTKDDYIVRAYALPPKYGALSKAYIVQDEQLEKSTDFDQIATTERIKNPLALNMYILGQTGTGTMTTVNAATKENLRTYLSQYRLMTDAINIKNSWIINIGVKFNINTLINYNKNEVLLRCIDRIKQYFNINRWQINQPIELADLATQILLVEGVANIIPPDIGNVNNMPILITNKWRTADGYSGNIYDMDAAHKRGVIYPSMDPAIFELRFPNIDIEGKVDGDVLV